MTARLALGTAQFGIPYGLAAGWTRVEEADVGQLLGTARSGGIDMLDTAAAYGEAEAVLGRCDIKPFAIVSKTRPFMTSQGLRPEDLSGGLKASLARLGLSRIRGLLFHSAEDLIQGEGAQWRDAAEALKAQGLVEQIGVSVYDRPAIEKILNIWKPDIVQLPLSWMDRRLLDDGSLDLLAAHECEIHVRSVYLQGILLTPPEQLPEFLRPLAPRLSEAGKRMAAAGCSMLAAALTFLRDQPMVSRVIVGAHSLRQLEETLAAWHQPRCMVDLADLAVSDPRLVDPRNWSQA
ncbi:aldo/keto reductase [Ferrovibrio terrae]|uniref:aldo/keto reductase n=1 Tax=Ferrovibrio terrae TaxID=2594003 RepID=UPI003137C2A5